MDPSCQSNESPSAQMSFQANDLFLLTIHRFDGRKGNSNNGKINQLVDQVNFSILIVTFGGESNIMRPINSDWKNHTGSVNRFSLISDLKCGCCQNNLSEKPKQNEIIWCGIWMGRVDETNFILKFFRCFFFFLFGFASIHSIITILRIDFVVFHLLAYLQLLCDSMFSLSKNVDAFE